MTEQQAEVVPRGEREDLQRTAQATGERLGRQDTRIEGHDDHFKRFNGSVERIDATLHDMSVAQAVLTASVSAIQRQFADRDAASVRRTGLSVQVWCAIGAGFLTLVGIGVTIMLALIGILVSLWL